MVFIEDDDRQQPRTSFKRIFNLITQERGLITGGFNRPRH